MCAWTRPCNGSLAHLELLEEGAIPCPLHQAEQGLVSHLAHDAEGVESVVFAPVGLLPLQTRHHLCAQLALVLLALQQLTQEAARQSAGQRGVWVVEEGQDDVIGRGAGGPCG